MSALAVGSVPNAVRSGGAEGMDDYRGPLQPSFRLRDLSAGALAAVAREFQVQSHLLVSSGELALRDRFDDETAREMVVATCVGAGWVVTERLATALGVASDAAGLARVLALHPMLPPGLLRTVQVDGDQVTLTVRGAVAGVLDPEHSGACGVLARGDRRPAEALVHAIAPRAAVNVVAAADRVVIEADVGAQREPATAPDTVALTKIGRAASWSFATSPSDA